MELSVKNLSKQYNNLLVLDDISYTFEPSKITVVLGPSGCGKTTLLNIMCGLETEYAGHISGFPESKISYIFQNNRLLPWSSVLDNVTLPLKDVFSSRQQRINHAASILKQVQLDRFIHYKPEALSEGMQKRAALARAFANPGSLLLLDEPFSALDIKTKLLIMDLFLEIQSKEKRTAIVVTHDVKEAIYIGDYLIVLSQKPSRIIETLPNPLPTRDSRAYQSETAAELESHIYKMLLSN
jgi:NitT/TauT family transport system ATP-binding protein